MAIYCRLEGRWVEPTSQKRLRSGNDQHLGGLHGRWLGLPSRKNCPNPKGLDIEKSWVHYPQLIHN